METVAAAVISLALVQPSPAQPWWLNHVLAVSVRLVPGVYSTVDVEIRNRTRESIEVPIVATFWLKPVPSPQEGRPSESGTLVSVFDPTVDTVADEPAGDVELRLPVGGVRRARVDLGKLKWSLTPPLYVWIPRPLSQVADYAEYDLELQVVLHGMRWESVSSKSLRIRLVAR